MCHFIRHNKGLDKTIKISEVLTGSNSSESTEPYMMATGTVNGYDMNLYLHTQNRNNPIPNSYNDATANIYASALKMKAQNSSISSASCSMKTPLK